MRLIDADKLIDALHLWECYKYKNPKAYDTLMLYEILQAIEDQPTISQWIPVSERLPDDGELVLLTFEGSKKVDMETAIYDAKHGFAMSERFVGLDEIIAWMPLPEPYKESDNE